MHNERSKNTQLRRGASILFTVRKKERVARRRNDNDDDEYSERDGNICM